MCNKCKESQFFEGEFIPGEIYVDRNGSKYTFIAYTKISQPEQSAIFCSEGGYVCTRHTNGSVDRGQSNWDIIRHHVKKKGAYYVNVYPSPSGRVYLNVNSSDGFYSRKDADLEALSHRIACIRVEFEEGQFDE